LVITWLPCFRQPNSEGSAVRYSKLIVVFKLRLMLGVAGIFCATTTALADELQCTKDSDINPVEVPRVKRETTRQPGAVRQPGFKKNKPMQTNKVRWT
jgi:hypothetical protein